MSEVSVYLLSDQDIQAIHQLNKKPKGPWLIICDHGMGPCVQTEHINLAYLSDWRDALDAITPFANRSTVNVTISATP